MGLAVRVIPVVLCRGRQLVKGRCFDSWRSVGVAAQAVRVHQARQVDELVLLDIGATPEKRGPDLELVRELSEACFMPLAVGGGIRSLADVRKLLEAGADKVVLGTAAVQHPELIMAISQTVGRQALTVAIDVRGESVVTHCGHYDTKFHVLDFARIAERMGAGEILLTQINREGTLEGYDLALIHAVASAVRIPVIANGGAGSYDDMLKAVQAGADAVAAGALFQFTDATPKGAAGYLHQFGIEVRL